jgi:hypothetical protein
VNSTTTILAGLAAFILVPVASAEAQTPPPGGGLVPPRAIVAIVHSNGLDPVGAPTREGPTYVVRAVNRRGLLMRVVVDARSGQIRAVNQIVPGPGSPGPIAMRPQPYGPPPEFEPAPVMPDGSDDMPAILPVHPPVVHAPARPAASAKHPPLPRPRPANVAVVAKPVLAKPVLAKPVLAKPEEAKPIVAKPIVAKPDEAKPIEAKPDEAKPVVVKQDETKSVDAKAVDAKPAAEAKPSVPTPAPSPVAKSPPAPVAPINE